MGNLWPLVTLLCIFASDGLPEPPEFKEYSFFECEECGRPYYGDPHDATNYCERCGGKMRETTLRESNPEHETWEHLQNIRNMMTRRVVDE